MTAAALQPARAGAASVRRDGDTLVFAGALERGAVASLWRSVQTLRAGARVIDLRDVTRVDSAGLALLAELGDGAADISGTPTGLVELRAAYRLDERLGYTR